jgi:hypothetical protein
LREKNPGGGRTGCSRRLSTLLKTINHARDPCDHYYETGEWGVKKRDREKRASWLVRTKDFRVFGLRVERGSKSKQKNAETKQNKMKTLSTS